MTGRVSHVEQNIQCRRESLAHKQTLRSIWMEQWRSEAPRRLRRQRFYRLQVRLDLQGVPCLVYSMKHSPHHLEHYESAVVLNRAESCDAFTSAVVPSVTVTGPHHSPLQAFVCPRPAHKSSKLANLARRQPGAGYRDVT
jgi:hypothetical protein